MQTLLSALKTLVDDRYTKAEADALLGTNTNTLLANVALDGAGVWTFTRKDGTTVVYDTKLEKIAVNFTLEGDYLVLHHDDGTEDRVSLAAFRDHHQFADSDSVSWSWTGEENNRTFTASVRANSITLEMLALDAVAKIEADVAASGQNAAAAQDAKAQAQTAAGQASAIKRTRRPRRPPRRQAPRVRRAMRRAGPEPERMRIPTTRSTTAHRRRRRGRRRKPRRPVRRARRRRRPARRTGQRPRRTGGGDRRRGLRHTD